MIARLTGLLEELDANRVLLVPTGPSGAGGGVAYELLVPTYLAERLSGRSGWVPTGEPMLGQVVTLYTLAYLESQNQGASFLPRLLGFGSSMEREFFELLTTVKGLGNRRALRAMAVEPGLIARAIAERDARFLQGLPEIGPKLAELIVHELRSKADRFVLLPGPNAGAAAGEAARAPATSVEPKPAESPRRRGKAGGPQGVSAPAAAPVRPVPPVRQTVDALVALGESPTDAERMVARALDRARSSGQEEPRTAEDLLAAAYAAR